MARTPTDRPKEQVFRDLGYGGGFAQFEGVLEVAGLSRPAKGRIAVGKIPEVRRLLAERFLSLCNRGDCQAAARDEDDGRILVPAARQADCAYCGGSANALAVDAMVAALRDAGLTRLCVVGGSPMYRTQLESLVAGRVELRLVEGTISRTRQQSNADLAWADRVALWGATILDHKVSGLYQGPKVVRFARRSIQVLAGEVARSVRPGR